MAVTASGSRHSVAMVAEVTYGTTPATPAFTNIRYDERGCSLNLSKDAIRSTEITTSRHVQSQLTGARKIGGDINFELSYGSFDTILEAVMCGTWTNNVLKAGTTRRSFTIERLFADLACYMRFTGCEFNKISLQATANAIVSGTVTVIGQDMATDTAAITGATYASGGTTVPVVSFSGTLKEGGTTIAAVTEMQLSLENGLAEQFVIGSKLTVQPAIGLSNCTGQITAYFQDRTLIDKFVNDTESSLEIEFPDAAGNKINLKVPRLLYTGAPPDVKGTGPLTLTMPFQALLDSGTATNLLITRTPHA